MIGVTVEQQKEVLACMMRRCYYNPASESVYVHWLDEPSAVDPIVEVVTKPVHNNYQFIDRVYPDGSRMVFAYFNGHLVQTRGYA